MGVTPSNLAKFQNFPELFDRFYDSEIIVLKLKNSTLDACQFSFTKSVYASLRPLRLNI